LRFTLWALTVLTLSGCRLWGAGGDCVAAAGYAIAATATSAIRVDLFYQAPFGSLPSGTIIYMLFRGTSPGNLTEIAKTTSPFYEESNLTPATNYYYEVHATSHGSAVSGATCVTTPAFPDPPGNITATVSPTSVTLSWTEAVGPDTLAITGFNIYRGNSPSSLSRIAMVKAVSFTNAVSPGTTYYYALQAIDTLGDVSPASIIIQVTTPPIQPRL